MDILIIMLAGVVIGNRLFPRKYRKLNERLQVICTALLIFTMGITLGQRENFVEELLSLGFTSFLLFLIPAVCSTILVFFLTKWLMNDKKGRN